MGKVEALLADAGRPWSYAVRLAKRMYRRDKLEWCGPEELRGIVAALSNDAARRKRRKEAR
jgi:phage gp16-like protein